MPKDKTESHDLIIKVAKQEFLEKGFMNVSMREIGKKVGLTQAALYRHFKSKEDMFNSLVEPFINQLLNYAKIHEKNAYESYDKTKNTDVMVSDNVVIMMKHFLKNNRDELKLIISCSHGTKYENFIHDLVKDETKQTLKAFDYIRSNGGNIREISEEELHVLLSAYMSAVMEPIVHDWPYEKAVKCLDLIEEFFIPAWKNLMGF